MLIFLELFSQALSLQTKEDREERQSHLATRLFTIHFKYSQTAFIRHLWTILSQAIFKQIKPIHLASPISLM